jgi:hypothetical protein
MSTAPISGYQMGRAIGLTVTPKDYTGVLANLTTQAKARKARGDQEKAKQKKENEDKLYERYFKLVDKEVDYTVQPILKDRTRGLYQGLKSRINEGYTDPGDFLDLFEDFRNDASYISQVGQSNKKSREAGQNVVNPFYDFSINTARTITDLNM